MPNEDEKALTAEDKHLLRDISVNFDMSDHINQLILYEITKCKHDTTASFWQSNLDYEEL